VPDTSVLNAASFDAVSGCTRALAGTADTDAAFGVADAASLSSLRAFGDRIAVRQRFQDPQIHHQWRPSRPGS